MPSMPTATDVAPVVPSSRLRTTRRSATLAGRLPGPVQTAGRVALEVERDEFVAGRPQRADDAFALGDQARDLSGLDLDARDLAVVADPHMPKTERLVRGLGRLDLPQRLDRDLGAMRDARGEAGEGRLVPVGQSESPRGGTDVRLCHSRLEQREADTAADSGAMAGPVIIRVVGGRAVDDVVETEVAAHRLQCLEELLLAVEAAIRVVAPVSVQLDLTGRHLDQPR